MKRRVRLGWLVAAVVAASISGTMLFGFRTGSCLDSADAASSTCTQGADPIAVTIAVNGGVFVIFALVRALRRA